MPFSILDLKRVCSLNDCVDLHVQHWQTQASHALQGFKTNDKGEKVGYCTMVYSESEVQCSASKSTQLSVVGP